MQKIRDWLKQPFLIIAKDFSLVFLFTFGVFLLSSIMALVYYFPTSTTNEIGMIGIFDSKPQELKLLFAHKYYLVDFEDLFIKQEVFIPKGYKPIAVIPPNFKDYNIIVTDEAKDCFSYPPYHMDFDKDSINALRVNSANLRAWLSWAKGKKYYVSDGSIDDIYIDSKKNLKMIKAYSKKSGKRVVYNKKQEYINENYLTKEEAQKNKKLSHRGIYITYYVARTPNFLNSILSSLENSQIDTLIIDFKESYSNFLIKNEFVDVNTLKTLEVTAFYKNLTKQLHAKGYKLSARIVVFKDYALANYRQDLAIRNKENNKIWRDRSGAPWADPYSEEVRKYNIDLAELAAYCGFDEIQYDYIRFPTEGKISNCIFPHNKNNEPRFKAIEKLLNETVWRLKPYNVSLAADTFGVALWNNYEDRQNLGQRMDGMAEYLDVISPMLYPSHFHAGYDGYAWPANEPYYFINQGCEKLKKILNQSNNNSTKIVPWLQGFDYKVTQGYGPEYMQKQIKAVEDSKCHGYLIWNARNRYDMFFNILR